MVRGVVYALSACFIWGLIFVVPQFIPEFSAIEVALGRYLFYGIVSFLIFCKLRFQSKCRYPLVIWRTALYFSLISTFTYYTFLVLGLRYSSPAISALILGISPIAIAFYGNLKEKEIKYKKLIFPSILIGIGLVMINIPHMEATNEISSYFLGIVCTLGALIAWSWYVVANARFLKQNIEVHPIDWSTLIGVTTLFWVFIFALVLQLFFQDLLYVPKYLTLSSEITRFIIASAVLGICCSWLGAFLWNKASFYLPVSLIGQLTIFETIFGVIFVYIIAKDLPSMMESIGIGVLLIAIIYGIRQFSKNGSNKTIGSH